MNKWYLGSMNDALFIIDKPPSPAMNDVGPWDNPNGPNPISAAIDDRNGKLIVDAHNSSIDELVVALKEARKLGMKIYHNANAHEAPKDWASVKGLIDAALKRAGAL